MQKFSTFYTTVQRHFRKYHRQVPSIPSTAFHPFFTSALHPPSTSVYLSLQHGAHCRTNDKRPTTKQAVINQTKLSNHESLHSRNRSTLLPQASTCLYSMMRELLNALCVAVVSCGSSSILSHMNRVNDFIAAAGFD